MWTADFFVHYAVAFAFTQAVECPIYMRAFKLRFSTAFGASLITHPFVCFAFPALWRALYLAVVTKHLTWQLSDTGYFIGYGILAESFAILTEAAWIAKREKVAPRRALLISIVANAASGLLGLVASYFTGYP